MQRQPLRQSNRSVKDLCDSFLDTYVAGNDAEAEGRPISRADGVLLETLIDVEADVHVEHCVHLVTTRADPVESRHAISQVALTATPSPSP